MEIGFKSEQEYITKSPKNQQLYRKLNIEQLLVFEKKIGVMEEPGTKAFIHRHQIQIEEFTGPLQKFVVETEKADAIWLHKQMEEHGTDVGLLWSAIHKPALIGEILRNFSSIDHLLKWIDVTRVER